MVTRFFSPSGKTSEVAPPYSRDWGSTEDAQHRRIAPTISLSWSWGSRDQRPRTVLAQTPRRRVVVRRMRDGRVVEQIKATIIYDGYGGCRVELDRSITCENRDRLIMGIPLP